MRLLGSRAKIGLAAVAVSCDALSWHFGCEGRRRKPALAEAATGGSSIPGDGAPFNSGGAGAGAGAGAGNGRPQHHPAAPHRAMMLARQNTARPRRSFYPYVIIGAGTTAHAAIEGILYHDPKADILMLTHEASLPRLDVKERERPIPKDLMASYNEWRRHIFCRLENEPGAFSSVPITLLLGRKRLCIDPERRMLTLDDGSEIEFNRCLIATAGKPRKFYVIDSDRSAALARDRLNVLGSLEDFQALQFVHESLPNGTAAVVGGGFLGTEVALALARRGVKVSQIYAEVAPLAAHLPIYLAEHVQQRLRRVGVQPVAERLVTEVRSADESDPESSIQVSLVGWELEQMVTDYVVLASTHVDPMVRVAKESGFEIDPNNGGIVVNGFMEAASGVFAAGSCASYYDPALGRRRVDMLDHSVNSGLLAGYNMAVAKSKQQSWGRLQQRHNATEENSAPVGHTVEESAVEDHCAGGGWVADATRPAKKSLALGIGSNPRRYVHQPTFRSNLEGLDILVEGVGRVDSSLRTVGIWVGGKQHRAATMGGPDEANAVNTQFTRGIVYYLNGTQVAGILLWNAPDLVDKARDVIRLQPTISSIESLRTLLALAPNEWLSTIEVQQAPAGTPERQLT